MLKALNQVSIITMHKISTRACVCLEEGFLVAAFLVGAICAKEHKQKRTKCGHTKQNTKLD